LGGCGHAIQRARADLRCATNNRSWAQAIPVTRYGSVFRFCQVSNNDCMYAGENGPALATHALCAAVLQNLHVINNRDPRLYEIAEFIRARAERYMRDWGERRPDHWKFTALIFGWCNVNHQLEAYQLIPELVSEI
jgi:hypothetical protein